jgi:xylulokinase
MYLGIDLGTSGIKAVLVDDAEHVVASHTEPLHIARPKPGWSEQTPEDWWQATLRALDAIAAAHPSAMAGVRGIGLSGQMHGAVLLDMDGQPLRPAILWNDTRSERECRELEESFPDLRRVAGNPAMPGFTAPKLLWVRKHEPEVFGRVGTVLLPKAYLRYRLTGEMIEEMSDAAGTLWLDVGARAWSEAALAATGLSLGQMPRLVEGSDPAGRLTEALCRRWGSARSGRAAPSYRSGHQAFSGRQRIDFGPTPRRRCTPSATPCLGSGIRWALPFPPPPASPGGAG